VPCDVTITVSTQRHYPNCRRYESKTCSVKRKKGKRFESQIMGNELSVWEASMERCSSVNSALWRIRWVVNVWELIFWLDIRSNSWFWGADYRTVGRSGVSSELAGLQTKSKGDLLCVRQFWLLSATFVVCLCRCHCSPQGLIKWWSPTVGCPAVGCPTVGCRADSNFPCNLDAADAVPPVGSGGGRRLCRGRHVCDTGKLLSSCFQ